MGEKESRTIISSIYRLSTPFYISTILTPITYKFVTTKTPEYKAGVALRIQLFFDGRPNALELINDAFEDQSIHLVALKGHQVVGTGRLYLTTHTATISQMTVDHPHQKQKIGQKILLMLVEKCRLHKIAKITLSARVTALNFYAKFGFEVVGVCYPSTKTGILHQKMERIL